MRANRFGCDPVFERDHTRLRRTHQEVFFDQTLNQVRGRFGGNFKQELVWRGATDRRCCLQKLLFPFVQQFKTRLNERVHPCIRLRVGSRNQIEFGGVAQLLKIKRVSATSLDDIFNAQFIQGGDKIANIVARLRGGQRADLYFVELVTITDLQVFHALGRHEQDVWQVA